MLGWVGVLTILTNFSLLESFHKIFEIYENLVSIFPAIYKVFTCVEIQICINSLKERQAVFSEVSLKIPTAFSIRNIYFHRIWACGNKFIYYSNIPEM